MKETVLPAACAVYATAAAAFLGDFGVRCRLIRFRLQFGDHWEWHIQCVFRVNGRLRCYDASGTRTLARGVTFDSKPKVVATAILRACYFKPNHPKKMQANWY